MTSSISSSDLQAVKKALLNRSTAKKGLLSVLKVCSAVCSIILTQMSPKTPGNDTLHTHKLKSSLNIKGSAMAKRLE